MSAADELPNAARVDTRAAFALFSVAVAGVTLFHLVPEWRWLAEVSYNLAFAVAGYAVTKALGTRQPDRPIWRALTETAASTARWGLPGLVLMLSTVLIAGVVFLPPTDLQIQAWTAFWTTVAFSGSELVQQGVYDPAHSGELLLHLWAVGVAVQLSVGWSLVVATLHGFRLTRLVPLAAFLGAMLSLGLEVWLRFDGFHQQAFLLSPANAWPFLLGAVAASRPVRIRRVDAWLAQAQPVTVIGPYVWAFHLWFWPLLAVPRMILARPLQPIEIAVALIAAASMAWLTHRLVERPIQRRLATSSFASFVAAALGLGGVGLASAALFAADGLPARAPDRLNAEAAIVLERPALAVACHVEGAVPPPAAACTTPPGGPGEIWLWSNSHASQISPALLPWGAERGLRLRQATRSGCANVDRIGRFASADCVAFNRAVLKELADSPPKLIILGGGFTTFLERAPGRDADEVEPLLVDLEAMLTVVRRAVGPETRVVILGNTPDFAFAPAACHQRRAFLGLDTTRCDYAVPANAEMMGVMDTALVPLAARLPHTSVFIPSQVLCDGGLCRTRGPDGPWYADRNHMSVQGALAQTEALKRALNDAMR